MANERSIADTDPGEAPSDPADRNTPDWLHLGEGDVVIWERRPHPITIGWWGPIGAVVFLVGISLLGWGLGDGDWPLTVSGAGLTAVGAGLAGWTYLVWTNTRYVITTNELYEKRGVISREITQFRLDRVQNTSLDQSMLGRVLGYGDLTVYTAGSGDPELTFEWVPEPEEASSVLGRALDASADGDVGP